MPFLPVIKVDYLKHAINGLHDAQTWCVLAVNHSHNCDYKFQFYVA
jgi:hypothetical protein